MAKGNYITFPSTWSLIIEVRWAISVSSSAMTWWRRALERLACSTFLLCTSKHSCSNCSSITSFSLSLSPTSSQVCCQDLTEYRVEMKGLDYYEYTTVNFPNREKAKKKHPFGNCLWILMLILKDGKFSLTWMLGLADWCWNYIFLLTPIWQGCSLS